MPKPKQTACAVGDKRRHLAPHERHDRKQRVLTQGTPSVVSSIADAIVLKNENLFFLTKPDGAVPLGGNHGFGLYYHDCRFLNGYELKLADASTQSLAANAECCFLGVFQLTNPDLKMANGRLLRKEQIGIKWERLLDAAKPALVELITCSNFESEPVEFPLSLTFEAEFEDVFAVRGLLPEKLGQLHAPSWKNGALSFVYEGADGINRFLSIHFSPAPHTVTETTAHFQFALQPEESQQLSVSLVLAEASELNQVGQKAPDQPDFEHAKNLLQRSSEKWVADGTRIQSDSLFLNMISARSLYDLYALKSRIDGEEYFAAGVPWFVTLFGRDSIITSLQTLAYDPKIAEHTLRLLAKFQCQEVDRWRDGQPGKIPHEIRIGEMARSGEIPHNPYYGTIDATPLWLILIGQHAAWTGDLTVFNDLRSQIELALEWIKQYGNLDGDGYLEYASSSEKGLINQGWKDSGDAIVNADGSLAAPPIALVEVQGYVYLAKTLLADLYERVGAKERASALKQEAAELRTKFNRDFWVEEKGIYALALQADNTPVAVVSSNPGQALWSGIAEEEKAQRTMERLMEDDMFNGWGIRTLSAKERRYNPIGYHLGTVWPHDNSIIAAGLRRYGFDEAARRVFVGILEAAMRFEQYRLPELFAGFARKDYGVPVHYPVACHPQAWAAGAIPYLLETALGLVPEAFDQRLRVVRPILPDSVNWLEVHHLRVGSAHADLRFERTADREIAVRVLKIDGQLEVVGP